MTGRIDAHQHFWNPARGDYHWMPEDHPVLTRPYGPSDLAPLTTERDVARSVLVQAAATVEETEYMLGIADVTPSVAGVVGWIDFEQAGHADHLERLAQHPKFLGVRPMIQDLPDDDWMLRDDVQWAYQRIIELDLTFDALGFPRHMANFHSVLTRYPDMRVVLDHCLKPQIRSHSADSFAFWAEGMSRLAGETAAFCKLSGIVTECDGWSAEKLRPYVDHLLAAFGPDRIMWGSDWPVCLLEASYGDWFDAAQVLTADLSSEAQLAIFGGTAKRFYRL
ncbi:MAG: amidohydrolase family protein [Pseudomonadota bacterium]